MDLDPNSLLGALGPNVTLFQLAKLRRLSPAYRAELYAQADTILRQHPDIPVAAREMYATLPNAMPDSAFAWQMFLFTAHVLGTAASQHVWRVSRALLRADLLMGIDAGALEKYAVALIGNEVLDQPWSAPEAEAIAADTFPMLPVAVEILRMAFNVRFGYISARRIFRIMYSDEWHAKRYTETQVCVVAMSVLCNPRIHLNDRVLNRLKRTVINGLGLFITELTSVAIHQRPVHEWVDVMLNLCAAHLYNQTSTKEDDSLEHAWQEIFGSVAISLVTVLQVKWQEFQTQVNTVALHHKLFTIGGGINVYEITRLYTTFPGRDMYQALLDTLIDVTRAPANPSHFDNCFARFIASLSPNVFEPGRPLEGGVFNYVLNPLRARLYQQSPWLRRTAETLRLGQQVHPYWTPDRVANLLSAIFTQAPPAETDLETMRAISVANNWPAWNPDTWM